MKRTATALALAGSSPACSSRTPAGAFNWSCIAKDKAGKEYEGRSFGIISPWIRQIATDRAMAKCEEAGGKSCADRKDCVDLDVQPRTDQRSCPEAADAPKKIRRPHQPEEEHD
jgi:hypothetical protein